MKFSTTLVALAAGVAAFPSSDLDRRIPYESNEVLPATLYDKRLVPDKSTCSDKDWGLFVEALRAAHFQSRRAQEAATNGAPEKMKQYFKSDSKETRERVAKVFGAVADELEGKDNRTSLSCDYKGCPRNQPAGARRESDKAFITACPGLFEFPVVSPPKTPSFSMAGVLLYEMTEIEYIGGTGNLGIPTPETVEDYEALLKSLSPEDSLKFAGSYSFFANSVYLENPVLQVTKNPEA